MPSNRFPRKPGHKQASQRTPLYAKSRPPSAYDLLAATGGHSVGLR